MTRHTRGGERLGRWRVWAMGLGAVAVAVGVAGCSLEHVRQATYPQGFRYVTKSTISTSMGRLAYNVQRLTELLGPAAPPPGPETQATVQKILYDMEQTIAELDSDGSTSNHPMLDRHLSALRGDVRAARTAAEGEDPNYYRAGAIAGSCLYCHR